VKAVEQVQNDLIEEARAKAGSQGATLVVVKANPEHIQLEQPSPATTSPAMPTRSPVIIEATVWRVETKGHSITDAHMVQLIKADMESNLRGKDDGVTVISFFDSSQEAVKKAFGLQDGESIYLNPKDNLFYILRKGAKNTPPHDTDLRLPQDLDKAFQYVLESTNTLRDGFWSGDIKSTAAELSGVPTAEKVKAAGVTVPTFITLEVVGMERAFEEELKAQDESLLELYEGVKGEGTTGGLGANRSF
jgi:hypothetical protein